MQVKSFSLKDGGVDIDARTFEGYASTWDKDLVGDIIMPGAFTKSINESFPAGRIKVLWNHGEPIGMPIEMREDERGLFVKGKISKTARGDEVLELMRDSVVDTMSIGFMIPNGKSETRADGVRIIREVRLMEFSPVTFAANPMAAITDVKRLGEMLREQELSDQDKKYLASFVADVQALVKAEPQSTQPASKPLELGELHALFKNFGESLGETK